MCLADTQIVNDPYPLLDVYLQLHLVHGLYSLAVMRNNFTCRVAGFYNQISFREESILRRARLEDASCEAVKLLLL